MVGDDGAPDELVGEDDTLVDVPNGDVGVSDDGLVGVPNGIVGKEDGLVGVSDGNVGLSDELPDSGVVGGSVGCSVGTAKTGLEVDPGDGVVDAGPAKHSSPMVAHHTPVRYKRTFIVIITHYEAFLQGKN